jgi:hypothetical protein
LLQFFKPVNDDVDFAWAGLCGFCTRRRGGLYHQEPLAVWADVPICQMSMPKYIYDKMGPSEKHSGSIGSERRLRFHGNSHNRITVSYLDQTCSKIAFKNPGKLM